MESSGGRRSSQQLKEQRKSSLVMALEHRRVSAAPRIGIDDAAMATISQEGKQQALLADSKSNWSPAGRNNSSKLNIVDRHRGSRVSVDISAAEIDATLAPRQQSATTLAYSLPQTEVNEESKDAAKSSPQPIGTKKSLPVVLTTDIIRGSRVGAADVITVTDATNLSAHSTFPEQENSSHWLWYVLVTFNCLALLVSVYNGKLRAMAWSPEGEAVVMSYSVTILILVMISLFSLARVLRKFHTQKSVSETILWFAFDNLSVTSISTWLLPTTYFKELYEFSFYSTSKSKGPFTLSTAFVYASTMSVAMVLPVFVTVIHYHVVAEARAGWAAIILITFTLRYAYKLLFVLSDDKPFSLSIYFLIASMITISLRSTFIIRSGAVFPAETAAVARIRARRRRFVRIGLQAYIILIFLIQIAMPIHSAVNTTAEDSVIIFILVQLPSIKDLYDYDVYKYAWCQFPHLFIVVCISISSFFFREDLSMDKPSSVPLEEKRVRVTPAAIEGENKASNSAGGNLLSKKPSKNSATLSAHILVLAKVFYAIAMPIVDSISDVHFTWTVLSSSCTYRTQFVSILLLFSTMLGLLETFRISIAFLMHVYIMRVQAGGQASLLGLFRSFLEGESLVLTSNGAGASRKKKSLLALWLWVHWIGEDWVQIGLTVYISMTNLVVSTSGLVSTSFSLLSLATKSSSYLMNALFPTENGPAMTPTTEKSKVDPDHKLSLSFTVDTTVSDENIKRRVIEVSQPLLKSATVQRHGIRAVAFVTWILLPLHLLLYIFFRGIPNTAYLKGYTIDQSPVVLENTDLHFLEVLLDGVNDNCTEIPQMYLTVYTNNQSFISLDDSILTQSTLLLIGSSVLGRSHSYTKSLGSVENNEQYFVQVESDSGNGARRYTMPFMENFIISQDGLLFGNLTAENTQNVSLSNVKVDITVSTDPSATFLHREFSTGTTRVSGQLSRPVVFWDRIRQATYTVANVAFERKFRFSCPAVTKEIMGCAQIQYNKIVVTIEGTF